MRRALEVRPRSLVLTLAALAWYVVGYTLLRQCEPAIPPLLPTTAGGLCVAVGLALTRLDRFKHGRPAAGDWRWIAILAFSAIVAACVSLLSLTLLAILDGGSSIRPCIS